MRISADYSSLAPSGSFDPLVTLLPLFQVVEILQTTAAGSSDLFSPELDKERKQRRTDPVATDLLGALLAVGLHQCLIAHVEEQTSIHLGLSSFHIRLNSNSSSRVFTSRL